MSICSSSHLNSNDVPTLRKEFDYIRRYICQLLAGGSSTVPTLQEVTTSGNTTTNDIILNIVPNVTFGKLVNDGGSPSLVLQETTNVGMNLFSNAIQFYSGLGVGTTLQCTSFSAIRTVVIPDLSGTLALMGANNAGDFTISIGGKTASLMDLGAGLVGLRVVDGTEKAEQLSDRIIYSAGANSLSLVAPTPTATRTINLPDLSGIVALLNTDNTGDFTIDGEMYFKPGTTDRYRIYYDSGNAALRLEGNNTIFDNINGAGSFGFRDATNGTYVTFVGGNVGIGNFASNGYKLEVTGSVKTAGRFQKTLGANVASANNLTLGTDGNVFHITGTTTINAITTANWSAGSEITFIFDSTPTVKNNTAGGAGTAKMLLAGGADFAATANDVLKLVYDGTSWFEVSRSIN